MKYMHVSKTLLALSAILALLVLVLHVTIPRDVAHYAQASRIDPISSLAGTDIAKVQESIRLLSESRDHIANLYEGKDKEIVMAALHPVAYLDSLVQTEKLHRALAANANHNAAKKYHESLLATLRLHTKYTKALESALEEIQARPFAQGRITFTNGSLTNASMRETLKTIREQTVQQKKKERARWRCYQFGISCHDLSYAQIAQQSHSESAETETPAHVRRNTNILMRFRENISSGSFPKHKVGILSESSCYHANAEPVVYILWRKQTDSEPFLRPNLVNDLVFADTHERRNLRNYFDAIQFQGARYSYQPLANYYMCVDLGHDSATLAAMLFVAESLQEEAVFPLHTLPSDTPSELLSDVQRLQSLEDHILASESLTQSTIEEYTLALRNILQKYAGVLPSYFSMEEILRAEDIVVAYANKSAYFDELVLHARDNNRFLDILTAVDAHLDIETLLYTRSFAPLLLGVHNKSILPQPTVFADTSKRTSLPEFDSYNTELSQEFTAEEIYDVIVETLRIEKILEEREPTTSQSE